MALYFARHGQTDWNVLRRWQSITDIPLNSEGRQQSQILADLIRCRKVAFTQVFCSPMSRAVETAEILTCHLDVPVQVDARLIELDFGRFEWRFDSALENELGDEYIHWKHQMYLNPAPCGEGIRDGVRRVASMLPAILEPPGNVLIVGHQGINIALKAKLSNCFTTNCLSMFRQKHDESDIWDGDPAKFQCRIHSSE